MRNIIIIRNSKLAITKLVNTRKRKFVRLRIILKLIIIKPVKYA